ncbi:MAG TPA: hypothetical protein VF025_05270 [Gaiellaceae bacterium]
MAIVISKVGDAYTADVTPPHGGGNHWRTESPLPADVLIAELLSRGCHQTDIGDAFYAADPDWLGREPDKARVTFPNAGPGDGTPGQDYNRGRWGVAVVPVLAAALMIGECPIPADA